MNNHHHAHYAAEAVLAVLLVIAIWTGARALNSAVHQKHAAAAHEWASLGTSGRDLVANALRSDVKRSARIACVADCGALPADLDSVFDAIGWLHGPTAVFGTPAGVIVSPDDADGRRIAASLRAASPELSRSITVMTIDDAGPLVIIGRKQR